MTIHEMNEELNEMITMKDIKNKAKDTLDAAKQFGKDTKREVIETAKMIKVAKDALKHALSKGITEKPSKEEILNAKNQLKDIGKITALLPLFAAPGGGLAIAALFKLAEKNGYKLAPSKSF